jgi:hypothetical protein
MTQDEAVAKLRSYGANADQEQAHGDADGVLLAVLRANGFAVIADEWEALSERVGGFWYA